jgi:hypothetical protein
MKLCSWGRLCLPGRTSGEDFNTGASFRLINIMKKVIDGRNIAFIR